MEVTQLESTIAPPLPTSPTQVSSQSVVQTSPKNTSLKKQVDSVHEEKKNKCSKCDASFRFKQSLKKHIASDHAKKKPEKCPSKNKIEVKVKRLRNSRNQNLAGKTKVSSRGRIIKVTPKILNQKNEKCKKKRKSKVKSKVSKVNKEFDRFDDESDRTYEDDLVGKKLSCRYDTGWHFGSIEYFNIKLKEYVVFFDDGSHDCIKKDDIDGKYIILLEWLYRSNKRRSMPKGQLILKCPFGVFKSPKKKPNIL